MLGQRFTVKQDQLDDTLHALHWHAHRMLDPDDCQPELEAHSPD